METSNRNKEVKTIVNGLKLIRKGISGLLGNFGRAVVYKYSNGKFEHTQIAGPVYLVEMSQPPNYQIMIINVIHQKERMNLFLPIESIVSYEYNDKFIYIRSQENLALWFPEKNSHDSFIKCLKKYKN